MPPVITPAYIPSVTATATSRRRRQSCSKRVPIPAAQGRSATLAAVSPVATSFRLWLCSFLRLRDLLRRRRPLPRRRAAHRTPRRHPPRSPRHRLHNPPHRARPRARTVTLAHPPDELTALPTKQGTRDSLHHDADNLAPPQARGTSASRLVTSTRPRGLAHEH